MWNRKLSAMTGILLFGLLLSGSPPAAIEPMEQTPVLLDESKVPDGVIGISLHIGANRIGDPALLYIGRVHREGPAHKAGLRHGDELISVDGIPVSGKNYEQVAQMVRGEVGSTVTLQIKRKGEESPREISITRVAGDHLAKRPAEHGTYKDKPQAQP